jgi:hypothetical protein
MLGAVPEKMHKITSLVHSYSILSGYDAGPVAAALPLLMTGSQTHSGDL